MYASGSSSDQASLKSSTSLAETRSELMLPSDEKFSRITATTKLRKMKEPRSMNEMK